jgi:predicted dehydrogenase
MRFAIVGCGRISPNHICAAIDNGLEIVALCDMDLSVIDRMIEYLSKKNMDIDLSKVKRYTSYKELLKYEKPDIVTIATPSGSHAEISLACIQAKANVIIEKPIALSIGDADAIIEAAKHNGVIATVCHQNRYNKSVQATINLLQTEQVGKIYYISAVVHWNRNKDYYTQAPWRGTWQDDGGCLMNQCIHNIDLLLWLINKTPVEVKGHIANVGHPYIESEDIGATTILFDDGSIGIVNGTTLAYPENLEETLSVFAEKAIIKLGGKSVNHIVACRVEGKSKEESEKIMKEYSDNPPNVYGFGHTKLYKDFIHAIRNKKSPAISLIDGKRAMEIVLATYKSAKTGETIKLPLENFSTLNMRGFFKHGV